MTTTTSRIARTLAVTAAAALIAACGGSGGDGSKSQTGILKIGITDAPVDMAAEVRVQFSGVELKPKSGAAFTIDLTPARSFDLLHLTGTTRAMLLDGVEVPAGEYEWVRLMVNADPNVANDSYLVLEEGGMQCEMRVPSGDQTGLKLVRGFTVGVGSITDFTIDFDLRKSIVAPPGQNMMGGNCSGQVFTLKPVLRMVNNLQVGAITGTVDSNLVAAECASSTAAPYPGNVYLFGPLPDGVTDVTPDDYDGKNPDANGLDALTSAMVKVDTFTYTIGFVPSGRYEVAYTCDLDDTTVDADETTTPEETVDFTPVGGIPVTVEANKTSEVNFVLPPPAP